MKTSASEPGQKKRNDPRSEIAIQEIATKKV